VRISFPLKGRELNKYLNDFRFAENSKVNIEEQPSQPRDAEKRSSNKSRVFSCLSLCRSASVLSFLVLKHIRSIE
jgi:hypothetical protein